jgi:hypothetical protein
MHSNKKYIRIDTHEKAEYEIIAGKKKITNEK